MKQGGPVMDKIELGGKSKVDLLVRYLTNLPGPLTSEELHLMRGAIGTEGCARLHVASQNAENVGRTTVRFSSIPGDVDEVFPNILEDRAEVTSIAGFILGMKKSGADWVILESFIEEYFANGGQANSQLVEDDTTDNQTDENSEKEIELNPEDCVPVKDDNDVETRKEVEEGVEKLNELCLELEQIRSIVASHELELKQVNDNLGFLTEAKKNALFAKEELGREVDELTHEIIEIRKSSAELKSEVAKRKEEAHDIELDALNTEQAAAEKMAECKARLQAAEELNAQADLFLNKAEQLEADAAEKMQEAEARIATATTEMAELEAHERKQSNESLALVAKMDEIGISQELREKLKPEVDEAVRYQAAIYTLSLIKVSAEKLAGQVRDEVVDLAAECRVLGERRTGLDEQIAELSSSCDSLTENVRELTDLRSSLSEEISSLENDIAEMEKNLDQARQESRAINSNYHDTLAKYREAIEDKNRQMAEAEADFLRQQAIQQDKISKFEQMTASVISEAQTNLQKASKSCADRVAELEAQAVRAKEKADSESARLKLIITEAETALDEMRVNAENRVRETHNKAAALVNVVQEVQAENLSSLQAKLEEMEQFDRFFDIVMVSLKEAKSKVQRVYEESEGLNKTYQSLFAIRMKEAEEIDVKMSQALALVEQICAEPIVQKDDDAAKEDLKNTK